MPAQGPNYPTAAGTDGTGIDWTNPGNAQADDGAGATCALALGFLSSELYVTGFGFELPSKATTLGFVLEVKKQDALQGTEDSGLELFKSGNQGLFEGNGAPIVGAWPASYAYSSYGSATNLWGQSSAYWTVAAINDSGFGAGFIAIADLAAGTPDVDAMRLTVYYKIRTSTLIPMGVGALLVAVGLAQAIAPMAAYFFAALAGLTLAWLGRVQKQTRTALAR